MTKKFADYLYKTLPNYENGDPDFLEVRGYLEQLEEQSPYTTMTEKKALETVPPETKDCIIDAIECARTDGEHNGFIVGVRFLSWLMANLQGGKES